MLDQLHGSGVFTYEMAMYVNTGKNAYFNIQGSNTIGDLYTLNFTSANGNFYVSDASNIELLSSSHPTGQWFTMRIEANLTTGVWAGIAVHNEDPMVVVEYDTGIGGKISGYPSALVDRGSEVDPSAMTPDFITRVQTPPAAVLTNGATWDASTRTLNVSVRANFPSAKTGQYKMACVLTEDHVTGTSSGYNQANYYSYQSNNADLIDDNGTNWKDLAHPVPAAQMEYNHVARAINGSFNGTIGCIPSSVSDGEEVILNFDFVLPTDWNEDNIHIVGMLLSPNGRIDNGSKTTITEAVANGFEVGCDLAGVAEMLPGIPSFELMPNPATSEVHLVFNEAVASSATVEIVDMAGKVMVTKEVDFKNGNNTTEINTSELQKGMYIVKLMNGEKQSIRRLVIQ